MARSEALASEQSSTGLGEIESAERTGRYEVSLAESGQSGTHLRSGPVVLAGLWAIVAALLTMANATWLVPLNVRLVAVSLLLFTAGLILAAWVARPLTLRASLKQLKLGPWISVGYSIVFGLATLIWLRRPQGSSLLVDRNVLISAGLITFAGLIALLAGYRATPAPLIRGISSFDATLRGASHGSPSGASVVVLWAMSLMGQALTIATGRFGYLSDPNAALNTTSSISAVLALLTQLGLLSSLLAAWRYATARTASSASLLTLVLLSQVALGLFAAQKGQIIIQIIAAFIGYGVRRRIRIVPVAAAVLVIVFVLTPLITQYRSVVAAGGSRLSPAETLTSVSVQELYSSTQTASPADSFYAFMFRLSRLGDVTIIVQKTPKQVPYASPVPLLEAPVLGLIPRSLWPGKPVLDAGVQMSSTYYELPTNVLSSSAMTPYGDLWRRGGLLVVLVGMAAIGMFARVVDGRAGNPMSDPRMLFLPMLLFTPLVKQESDYVGLLASFVGVVVLATLATRLVDLCSPAAADGSADALA